MWTTNTDPFLKRLDLLLLLPLLISILYAACHRYWRGSWEISKAIVLGFSLPLALIYTMMLWTPQPSLSFMDNFSWQVGLIALAAPQSIVLYPIGFFAWAYLFRRSRYYFLTLPIVAITAIVGHFWTKSVLAAL